MAADISRPSGLRNEDSSEANRRRSPRIDTGLHAAIRADSTGGAPRMVDTLDLSHDGMGIRTRHTFQLDEQVEVDLECELPLRVHLGYEIDSLVIDGPMHRQLVTVTGFVRRRRQMADGRWLAAITFSGPCDDENRRLISDFVDHVRTHEMWSF